MADYRMKAEGLRDLFTPPPQEPEVFRADVGSLRKALAELPADLLVRVSVQGSDVGVCELVQLDVKDGELMVIGAKVHTPISSEPS